MNAQLNALIARQQFDYLPPWGQESELVIWAASRERALAEDAGGLSWRSLAGHTRHNA